MSIRKTKKVMPMKRGRPRTGQMPPVTLRIDNVLQSRIDQWAERLPAPVKRSTAIRMLIERGLQ